jgi:hypothetical protein
MSDSKKTTNPPDRGPGLDNEPRTFPYRGFSIERPILGGDLYAVRYYQEDPYLVHDFKPWCDSLEETKAVVDKLVANAQPSDDGDDDSDMSPVSHG